MRITLALVLLGFIAPLFLIGQAQAAPYPVETFDSYTAGCLPGPGCDGVGPGYTFTASSLCRVSNQFSQTAPNSVHVASCTNLPVFTLTPSCSVQSFEWDNYWTTNVANIEFSAGEVKIFSSGQNLFFELQISGQTGGFFARTFSSTAGAAVGNTQPLTTSTLVGSWHHMTMSTISCSSNVIFRVSVDGLFSTMSTTFTGITPTSETLGFADQGNAYVDNLVLPGYSAPAGASGFIFCSDPGATNFAYDYKEDVSKHEGGFSDGGNGFAGSNPFYEFAGTSTDFAYLGNAINGGSKALNTTFRIEAATDGGSSIFRTTYSFVNSVPSSTTKGDGGYPTGTQSFDDYVEAFFQEVGNSWRIAVMEKAAGSAVVQVGSALFQGTPNDRHTYQFQVDTRTNPPTAIVRYEGTTILTRSLTHAQNSVIRAQWFVGYGTATFLADYTALAQTDAKSTCIWNLDSTGTTTNPGSAPESVIVPGTSTNTAASSLTFLGSAISAPEGFTASTFGLFLGVILIAALAAGFYFIHQSATMAGGGALAGVFLSFSFGLIGLWVILVLVILAAGVIFMRFRSGA